MRMVIAALLCWLVGGTAVFAEDCGASGSYDGQTKMPDQTLDISLDLYCADGRYAAQLFTSEGEFAVKSVNVAPDRVRIQFDSGASLGDILGAALREKASKE